MEKYILEMSFLLNMSASGICDGNLFCKVIYTVYMQNDGIENSVYNYHIESLYIVEE